MADEGGNDTSGEETMPGFYAPYDVFPIVLCVLIVLANSTAIGLVLRKTRLRTVTNGVLASLAVSDLLAGLVGVPLYLACSTTFLTPWCHASVVFWRFVSISTVLHLTLVTLDRYVAIVHVMRYETIVTRNVGAALVSVTWICAAFVSLIQLSWAKAGEDIGSEEDEIKLQHKNLIYAIAVLVIFLGIPLATMVYSYVRILLCVRHYRSKNKASTRADPTQKNDQLYASITTHWKTALVFAAMIVAFVIFWTPYFTLELLLNYQEVDSLPEWAWYVLFYFTRFTASLVNPLIYVLGKHDFRAALCECLRCSRIPDDSTTNRETMQDLV